MKALEEKSEIDHKNISKEFRNWFVLLLLLSSIALHAATNTNALVRKGE